MINYGVQQKLLIELFYQDQVIFDALLMVNNSVEVILKLYNLYPGFHSIVKNLSIKITGIKKGFIISIYILLSVSFICDDPLVAEKPKTKGTHLHIPKRFTWRRSIFFINML